MQTKKENKPVPTNKGAIQTTKGDNMITISLQEKSNNLIAIEPITPIVCGNSNYCIEIAFSESWNSITNKVAIVVVGNQKTAISFTGNTFKLPALPNTFKLSLVIMSDETETEKLTTSVLELETEPTLTSASIEEFEPLSEYAQTVLGKITEFANGTAKVKFAETADTAKNTSNPNLLINSDFRVNQRGQTTYTGTTSGTYTADRWCLYDDGGTFSTQTNTLTIANQYYVFVQSIEDYASLLGKTLTLSIKVSSISSPDDYRLYYRDTAQHDPVQASITGPGIFTYTFTPDTSATKLQVGIRNRTAGASISFEYIKLELGTTATTFSPRPYAEELVLCQRYYQKIKSNYGGTNLNMAIARSSTTVRIFVNLTATLRTAPTIINKNINIFKLSDSTTLTIADNSLTLQCCSNNQCVLNFTTTGLTAGTLYFVSDANGLGQYELDAELY